MIISVQYIYIYIVHISRYKSIRKRAIDFDNQTNLSVQIRRVLLLHIYIAMFVYEAGRRHRVHQARITFHNLHHTNKQKPTAMSRSTTIQSVQSVSFDFALIAFRLVTQLRHTHTLARKRQSAPHDNPDSRRRLFWTSKQVMLRRRRQSRTRALMGKSFPMFPWQ